MYIDIRSVHYRDFCRWLAEYLVNLLGRPIWFRGLYRVDIHSTSSKVFGCVYWRELFQFIEPVNCLVSRPWNATLTVVKRLYSNARRVCTIDQCFLTHGSWPKCGSPIKPNFETYLVFTYIHKWHSAPRLIGYFWHFPNVASVPYWAPLAFSCRLHWWCV